MGARMLNVVQETERSSRDCRRRRRRRCFFAPPESLLLRWFFVCRQHTTRAPKSAQPWRKERLIS
jgi:hypothetical protein